MPKKNKDHVKIRDVINDYGSKYGISDSMIGWNQKEGGGGSISIGGNDFLNVDKSMITDKTSYSSEDNIIKALDNYANQNGLVNPDDSKVETSKPKYDDTPLEVEDEMKYHMDDVTGDFTENYEDPYAGRIDKYLKTILSADKLSYDDPLAGRIDGELQEIEANEGFEYDDPYIDTINQWMEGMRNRADFDYNPSSDIGYQNLAGVYNKQGARASEDVMGQAADLTGGRTNSWSETVAAQQRNQFSEGLAAKVPQLQQAAFQRYMAENGLDQRDLENMMNASQMMYGRGMDGYQTGVNADQRALDNLMNVSNTNYGREVDSWESEQQILDRAGNMLFGASDRDFDRFANERNFGRASHEDDRNFGRNVFESDRGFQRGTYENDRNFNRGVDVEDRNFDRGIEVEDRNFNRNVDVEDRNYNRNTLESDRNFDFQSDEAKKAAQRWQQEFDYNVSRDQVMDDKWLDQFDFEKQQAAVSNALQSRQISVSEANAAMNRRSQNRNIADGDINNYLNYAADQLGAGKSETEVRDHITNLNKEGDISDEAYREIMNRFPAQEIVDHGPDNKLSVAWQEMMNPNNEPKQWLLENAQDFSDKEIQILEKYIPNKSGGNIIINR